MATTRLVLDPATAESVPGETFPQFKTAGSTVRVSSLSFDAAGTEACQWRIPYLPAYGSGNVTVKLRWYADTATSGEVVWSASLMALTPGDTQNAETDAWATENTATDTAGAATHDVVEASITVSNLDSVASGDYVSLRVRRVGGNGSDTMTGDAQLVGVVVEYSDT